MNTNDLPQALICALFEYRDNALWWKKGGNGRRFWKTRPAGTDHPEGYRKIQYKRVTYNASRLIWVMHYGTIPKGLQIDHKNRNRGDNRLENLRLVTHRENTLNIEILPSSGTWRQRSGTSPNPWMAEIRTGGKKVRLGSFPTQEQAHAAYLEAKAKYHVIEDRTPEQQKTSL